MAVKELEKLQRALYAIKKVDQARMEDYLWEEQYTCMLLRWGVGYLDDQLLERFLRRAACHLHLREISADYFANPRSYIVVLDYVAPPRARIGPVKGRLIRNEHDLLQIFNGAGLHVYRKSPLVELHADHYPVKAWSLV